MDKGQQTALITSASDYVGPPAVDALAEAGFRVLVQDPSFVSADSWRRYRDAHPAAERIDGAEPADAVAVAWEQAGAIDALVSNDLTRRSPARRRTPIRTNWTARCRCSSAAPSD